MLDTPCAAKIIALWAPASLQMVTDWMMPLTFNLFTSANIKARRLETEAAALEEDAVGLALMSLNLLLFATASGFNGAIDSYASIATGAQDRQELFAVLLRQLLLLAALAFIAALLLINAESLLLAIGVQAELAVRAAELLHLMGLAVPGDFLYDCMARWMRGQQLHRSVSVCSIMALSLNLLVNMWMMGSSDPTRGPLVALIAQNTLHPFLLVAAYLVGAETSPAQLLADIRAAMPSVGQANGQLVRQLQTAVAAMAWTSAELWAWGLQVFEAARLGTGNAAAYTLLFSTYSFISTFSINVTSAASALMGEAPGQDNPWHALRLLRAACTLTLLFVLGYTIPMYLGRSEVAALLCGGVVEVADTYTRTLPLVLSMHFLDGLFNAFKSWLVQRRKQSFGAAMSLIVYYFIGVPVGCYLAFWRSWGLLGLWAGLGLSVLLGVVAAGVQAVLDVMLLMQSADSAESSHKALSDVGSGDYVRADVLLDLQTDGSKASRHRASWRERCGHLVWLSLLLAPGIATFTALVASPVEQPPASFLLSVGRQILLGSSPCTWSTGGAFYVYPFTAFWNSTNGDYGWEVTIRDHTKAMSGAGDGRRMQAQAGTASARWLRFGTNRDVYDVPYDQLISEDLEVGWAAWLVQPEVQSDPNAPGEWTSYAFVGTRVSTTSHTFCGCQTMRGDARRFRLTEHGRAYVPIAQRSGGKPWYFNLTRSEINEQIRTSCHEISAKTTCPTENATAIEEWAAGKDNGTYWTLPPWVEMYDALPQ